MVVGTFYNNEIAFNLRFINYTIWFQSVIGQYFGPESL
jgi:hypothetical protein